MPASPRFIKLSRRTILVLPTLLVTTALLTTCSYDQAIAPATTPLPGALSADVTGPVPVLIGAGSIARCDRTNDEATARLLGAYPDATVLTAGDNIYGDGSITDFTNCYGPSWGQYKGRTRPAVGELDYKTTGAAGYFKYFGAAAAGDSAKYYYSYDLGAWHIVVLNDNISMAAGSAQEQWLRAELAANSQKCNLAYWHHPRFSSTGTNNLAAVKPLWDALYDYNADVVVNAHYDGYERFAPQTPAGVADPARGLREFIVGTGGQSLQNPGGAKPNSEVRNGKTYGVLKLTLDAGSYSWQFVRIAGQTFTDAGSTACHAKAHVASVEVSPASATVQVGATVQLTPTPRDASGNPLTGRIVTWATSDAAVATVSVSGLVGGVAAGSATITATSEGKTGQASITVPAATGAILVGAGDIAPCPSDVDNLTDGDDATAKLLDGIPGTVFTLGDNVYETGSAYEFTTCYGPSWGRHLGRTRPVPGNHDYNTSGAAGYFGYFGAAAGDASKGYYSYDLGDWHLIALNVYVAHNAGSAQEQWLRADLAASTKRCTLAYVHPPLFSSGSLADTTTRVLWQDLYAAGAEIVLTGHEHNYQRFAPQTPTGVADPVYGIREIIAGTGGDERFGVGTPLPNTQAQNASTFGVLKLTLYSTGYDWQFIPIAGQTFTDAGSGSCHDAPGAVNHAPTAAPGGPYSGAEGAAVSFDGSGSSDPDGDALTYAWTFGDGSSGTGATPQHAYVVANTYTVEVTVSDGRGGSQVATASAVVVPTADRAPPVVELSGPHEVLPGTLVAVSARARDNVGVTSVTFDVRPGGSTTVTTAPYE